MNRFLAGLWVVFLCFLTALLTDLGWVELGWWGVGVAWWLIGRVYFAYQKYLQDNYYPSNDIFLYSWITLHTLAFLGLLGFWAFSDRTFTITLLVVLGLILGSLAVMGIFVLSFRLTLQSWRVLKRDR